MPLFDRLIEVQFFNKKQKRNCKIYEEKFFEVKILS